MTTVRKSKAGWLIEDDGTEPSGALVQGCVAGSLYLVPFAVAEASGVTRDRSPGSEWNDYATVGDYLAEVVCGKPGTRCLRRGVVVR